VTQKSADWLKTPIDNWLLTVEMSRNKPTNTRDLGGLLVAWQTCTRIGIRRRVTGNRRWAVANRRVALESWDEALGAWRGIPTMGAGSILNSSTTGGTQVATMTAPQLKRLEGMTRVGRDVVFKHKGGGGRRVVGKVEDEVYVMVGDYKHVIQRIRFAPGVSWDGSEYAYRTGYYTYDASMRRIVWGQYTQFLTQLEYAALLGKVWAKGWPVFVEPDAAPDPARSSASGSL
jgi:hypothetical protein